MELKVGQVWKATKLERFHQSREIISVSSYAIRYATADATYQIFWPGWNRWVQDCAASPTTP